MPPEDPTSLSVNPTPPAYYRRYRDTLALALQNLAATLRSGDFIDEEDAFDLLCEMSRNIQQAGRRQYMCGNGASAAFANHMALDWTKNGGVSTYSFSDSALLTAMGNDLGYENAFSAPLSWYARSGDMLITISSSGSSPNILNTIETARAKGMQIITLSGLAPDNPSRHAGDLNIFVPSDTYGIAESAHQVILHVWLDLFIEKYQGRARMPD